MRKTILSMILFAASQIPAYPSLSGKINEANKLYNENKREEALAIYSKILARIPDSGIANFNMGALLYKNARYEDALRFTSRCIKLFKDNIRASMVNYNLGCVKYRMSQESEDTARENALNLLKESLNYYKLAIKADTRDLDSKYNYEYVLLKIRELEEELNRQEPEEKEETKQEEEEKQETREESKEEEPEEDKKNAEEEQKQEQEEKKEEEKEKEEQKRQEEKKEQEREKQEIMEVEKDEPPEQELEILLEINKEDEEDRKKNREFITEPRALPEPEYDW